VHDLFREVKGRALTVDLVRLADGSWGRAAPTEDSPRAADPLHRIVKIPST
jgi:hypothetical protein